jgi:hypothetical protein
VLSGGGYLSEDLDCSASSGFAVTIDGGKLDLRGFTLTGAMTGGIKCTAGYSFVSQPPGGAVDAGTGSGRMHDQ